MYKIDKDIPAPELLAVRADKYPLHIMAIGESFYVPLEASTGHTMERLRWNVQQAINYRRRFNKDLRFAIRTTKEKDGLRVWRLA